MLGGYSGSICLYYIGWARGGEGKERNTYTCIELKTDKQKQR